MAAGDEGGQAGMQKAFEDFARVRREGGREGEREGKEGEIVSTSIFLILNQTTQKYVCVYRWRVTAAVPRLGVAWISLAGGRCKSPLKVSKESSSRGGGHEVEGDSF